MLAEGRQLLCIPLTLLACVCVCVCGVSQPSEGLLDLVPTWYASPHAQQPPNTSNTMQLLAGEGVSQALPAALDSVDVAEDAAQQVSCTPYLHVHTYYPPGTLHVHTYTYTHTVPQGTCVVLVACSKVLFFVPVLPRRGMRRAQ